MRVTPTTMHLTVVDGMQRGAGRVQDAQAQLSSGRRINRYSDAPADATAALRLRGEADAWKTAGKGADDAIARLNTADTALQRASSLLQRVRELTVAAANTTVGPTEREGIAVEIEQIRDQLVGLANTRSGGQAVFGGFGASAVSGGPGTWSYSGDDGQVLRRVAPDLTIAANVDGKAAFGFGPGSTDVFTVLDQVAGAVRAGNVSQLGTGSITDLDAAATNIRSALGAVGARVNTVEGAQAAGTAQLGTIELNRSHLEDADVAETVLQMQQAEAGYQAALAAASRLSLPTLVDFLR